MIGKSNFAGFASAQLCYESEVSKYQLIEHCFDPGDSAVSGEGEGMLFRLGAPSYLIDLPPSHFQHPHKHTPYAHVFGQVAKKKNPSIF